MKLRKVGIIGTGHVGSHVAFSLALQGEVDELYMMDIDEKKAKAQAMDINDAVSYIPHKVTATAGPIEECGDCDVLVFSAGPLPNLYQDRLESLGDTVEVLKDVIPRIKKSGFDGFIISISNPADVVATYLCKHLNLNKSYFCKIFKSETGYTFTNYLNIFRVEKSKNLLKNPNMSLLDVAVSVGFNSQNYYSSVFKKITNKTPLEYKQEIKL